MHYSNAYSVWTDTTRIITHHNAHCLTSVDRPLEGQNFTLRVKRSQTVFEGRSSTLKANSALMLHSGHQADKLRSKYLILRKYNCSI